VTGTAGLALLLAAPTLAFPRATAERLAELLAALF
jgi:hypothetical protein